MLTADDFRCPFLRERARELERLQAERGKVAEELGDFERF
jgi:hypothetical protein